MEEKHYMQASLVIQEDLLYVENPTELFEKLPKITFDLQTKDIYANLYRRKEDRTKVFRFYL